MDMVVLCSHQQNESLDMHGSEMVINDEETAADSKDKESKLDAHVTCVVNSCQGWLPEFYSDKTTQIINML